MLDANDIGTLCIEAIALEWRKQGHELTGEAVRNMEYVVSGASTAIRIDGYLPDYMVINNAGVTRDRIPYSPGSGAKHSKYIAGLIEYAKKRMNASDKEAKSIAFAIASKHKREGMPTRLSARFSQTGRRTGFVETAIDAKVPEIEKLITDGIEDLIYSEIETFFKSVLKR